jgi:hypothetical protein
VPQSHSEKIPDQAPVPPLESEHVFQLGCFFFFSRGCQPQPCRQLYFVRFSQDPSRRDSTVETPSKSKQANRRGYMLYNPPHHVCRVELPIDVNA